MNFKIFSVKIECVAGTVLVPFSDSITFFYGNTGVGKTTLLNLINYALGQNLIRTSTVDDEVQRVCLDVLICDRRLVIERKVASNLITVKEGNALRSFSAKSDNSSKDTFSDYLYELAKIRPIEMLRGRSSKNVKISFANFMWYAYLRQDELDNTLFYLDERNGNYKQYASNYALRSMFDEEKVAKKEITQEINQITEKQENLQMRLSVMREIFSVSNLFKINIGREIAKKHQMVGQLRQELLQLTHSHSHDESQTAHLLNCAELTGRYDAEIRYLQEFSKIQGLRRQYEALQDEYEHERQKCLERLAQINDETFVSNVDRLQVLFHESLLDVGFPEFSKKDSIMIDQVSFVPSVYSGTGEFRFDYHTLSSSGIRTIFKICYTLAIHRFIREQGVATMLPTFMMVDTPMKNISERIDEELYTRLYHYFYHLFSEGGALYGMQLIIIDKELPEIFKSKGVAYKMYTNRSPLIPLSKPRGAM